MCLRIAKLLPRGKEGVGNEPTPCSDEPIAARIAGDPELIEHAFDAGPVAIHSIPGGFQDMRLSGPLVDFELVLANADARLGSLQIITLGKNRATVCWTMVNHCLRCFAVLVTTTPNVSR
jgi:hypothetical protein